MKRSIVNRFLLLCAIVTAVPLFSWCSQDNVVVSQPVRILVGSPIRQNSEILKEFLFSLRHLQGDIQFDFCFIDDNVDEQSSRLLEEFKDQVPGRCFIYKAAADNIPYVCDEITHHWTNETIWKVAAFKDGMINQARHQEYDYLFLIDSDIVLNPCTIIQLIGADKDIISEIFWTRWQPDTDDLPQVWISDVYTLTPEFVQKLRVPGVHQVGGLGACTLISKRALQAGVSFAKIHNLSYWGEDRHFCIRAGALGLSLFVDTHYPAYHIYRESALSGVAEFKRKNNLPVDDEDTSYRPHLTLSMCVKNEADHYLRRMLADARHYIDAAVLIDDASTDNTIAVCLEALKGIPVRIIKNNVSRFGNEITLREQQWQEVVKTDPDWILVLDADEIFEHNFKYEIRDLLKQENVNVFYFRLFDMWNETHYRETSHWMSHYTYRPFLVKLRKDFRYDWNRQAHHCGRLPNNLDKLPYTLSQFRLQHYGWATKEDRRKKYERYMQLDPGGKFGNMAQYQSIMDENPTLIPWS